MAPNDGVVTRAMLHNRQRQQHIDREQQPLNRAQQPLDTPANETSPHHDDNGIRYAQMDAHHAGYLANILKDTITAEWTHRRAALQQIAHFAHSTISTHHDTTLQLFQQLAPSAVIQLADLRSSLVKTAVETLSAILAALVRIAAPVATTHAIPASASLFPACASLTETLLTAILSLYTRPSAIYTAAADAALSAQLAALPHPAQALPPVDNPSGLPAHLFTVAAGPVAAHLAMTSAHHQSRAAAATHVARILPKLARVAGVKGAQACCNADGHVVTAAQSVLESVEAVIAGCVVHSDASVRDGGKKVWAAYQAWCPDRSALFGKTTDPLVRKRLVPSRERAINARGQSNMKTAMMQRKMQFAGRAAPDTAPLGEIQLADQLKTAVVTKEVLPAARPISAEDSLQEGVACLDVV